MLCFDLFIDSGQKKRLATKLHVINISVAIQKQLRTITRIYRKLSNALVRQIVGEVLDRYLFYFFEQSHDYQIETRSASGKYMASPSFKSKASAKAPI